MTRRPPLGLAVSALAHGALIAGLALVVPRADRLPPILVDLTQDLATGGRAAPVPAPPKISGARPAPSGKLASPARTAEPEEPSPAPPSPLREEVASTLSAPLTPADTQPPAVTPAIAPLPREETASAPLAPPAPAAEAAPPPPAIAPPPREERASAPAAPGAAVAASGPKPPAAAATSVVSDDGARWALGAAAPDDFVAPGPGRADVDVRGEAVASDAPTNRDAGDSGGESQGLALARAGTGADDPAAAYGGYLTGLRHRIQEALRYPLPARRRGLTGTVTIELTVLPNGAIGPVTVVESSAHPLLDEAALETAQSLRAEPFPAGLPPRTLRVRLPVVFQLR